MILLVASTDDAAQRLAPRLTAELNGRGLNAADVGRAIGMSQPTVWRWMNGESMPDHASIEKLQAFLGLRRGTVYRWAGLVDDGGLIDPDALGPVAARMVRSIVRDIEADADGGSDRE